MKPKIKPRNPFVALAKFPQGRHPRKAGQVTTPASQAVTGQSRQGVAGVMAQAHCHPVPFCHG